MKSSFCSTGACIEINPMTAPGCEDRVHIATNIGSPRGKSIDVTREEWEAFVKGVKNGDFDNLFAETT